MLDTANRISREDFISGKIPPAHKTNRATVTLNLPYPPSTNRLTRNLTSDEKQKYYQRGKKPPPRCKTERYEVWTRAAGNALLTQPRHLVPGAFSATILLALKHRKDRPDLDNRIKAVLDLLQSHQIIENDNLNEGLIVSWTTELEEGCQVIIRPATSTLAA